MATEILEIRITTSGADQTAAAMERIAAVAGVTGVKMKEAAAAAAPELKALDSVVLGVRTRFEEFAGRIPIVGSALTALGPAGLAAGAGLGAFVAVMTKANALFAASEQLQLRQAALLRATGDASGKSAADLDRLAASAAKSTLFSPDQFRAAEASLLTFRTVSGEVFDRAIKDAADFAAVTGQDLQTAAVNIGRALEAPEQGFGRLARAGIVFTAAEKDVILTLERSGDVIGAQKQLLADLETRIGGAAAGEAGGAAGAAHRLSVAWEEWLKSAANTGPIVAAENALSRLLERQAELDKRATAARSASGGTLGQILNWSLFGLPGLVASRYGGASPSPEGQAEEDARERARIRGAGAYAQSANAASALAQYQISAGVELASTLDPTAVAVRKNEEEQAKLTAAIAAAHAQMDREGDSSGALGKSLDTLSRGLELLKQKHAELLAPQAKAIDQLDQEIAKLRQAADAEQRLAAASAQGPAARRAAEIENQARAAALRAGPEGSAAYAAQYARAFPEIERAGAARSQAGFSDFASRASEENAAALSDLFGDAATRRESALQRKTEEEYGRLAGPGGPSREDVESVVRQGQAVQDFATGEQAVKQSEDKLRLAQQELSVAGQLPEVRQRELAIDQAITAALAKDPELTDEQRAAIERNVGAWIDLQQQMKRTNAASDELNTALERSFDRLGTSITDAFVKGKGSAVNFGNVLDGIISEVDQEIVRLAALNPLENAIFGPGPGGTYRPALFGVGAAAGGGGLLGGLDLTNSSSWLSQLFSGGGATGSIASGTASETAVDYAAASIAHGGGVVGVDRFPTRFIGAEIMSRAPKLARGYGPDEFPAILHRREEVLTPRDPRHVDNLRSGPGAGAFVHAPLSLTIVARDHESFRQSEGQVKASITQWLQAAKRNL